MSGGVSQAQGRSSNARASRWSMAFGVRRRSDLVGVLPRKHNKDRLEQNLQVHVE